MVLPRTTVDKNIWTKKAIAFVTRSHRHLWGKNNEDPLASLFLKGLENQFAKDMVLGWNKFTQERPMENWGIDQRSSSNNKLLLPTGFVVPYIINRELISIFITPLNEDRTDRPVLIPGSQTMTMVLDDNNKEPLDSVIMITNILDGLYLYQEGQEKTAIIICPFIEDQLNSDKAFDHRTISLLSKAKDIHYFYHIKDRSRPHPPSINKFLHQSNCLLSKHLHNDIFDHFYQSKEELLDMFYTL